MRQILHIVRKDIRHHWPEIAAPIALLIAYAWIDPSQWGPEDFLNDRIYSLLAKVLPPLLLVSWGFLVVRVIQGESLAGERQFWVTRPYSRWKLLVAKVLLLITTIAVPLLVTDIVLLHLAGFVLNPTLFL